VSLRLALIKKKRKMKERKKGRKEGGERKKYSGEDFLF
jgi:hypothetical protein